MFHESSDSRLKNNTGVFMPSGRHMQAFVHAIGFAAIMKGCYLENISAYLAYRRSPEMNWPSIRMEAPFLLYDFHSG